MSTNILGPSELKELYDCFHSQSKRILFDLGDVPPSLRRIAHYASFWGLSDDSERIRLLYSAPEIVKHNLKAVANEFEHELDEWLSGVEATSSNPSDAYIAYSAMRMAADMV